MSDIQAIIKIMSDLSNLGEQILFREQENRKMEAELREADETYVEMDKEIRQLKNKIKDLEEVKAKEEGK